MDDPDLKDISPPPTTNTESPVQETAPASSFSQMAESEAPVPAPLAPPPQAVVGHHGRKRGLKLFILVLLIAAIAGGGWYTYKKHQDNTDAAKAASQNKDIPLLKIGLYQTDYGNLYPKMNLNEYNFIINGQMFEGLVRYEDRSKIVPNLASNWTNPDDSTWLFTIKSGIKFHDGHTVTAKDVKYSIDTLMSDSNSDIAQTFADTIKSVDVVGNNQVKITTTVPDPVLLNKLSFLYVIDSSLPKGAEPSQAGTGPYEIKPGTKPTSTHVQMVAFDNYHEGRPTTRALDFSNGNTSSGLLNGLKTHQYNIVGPNLTVSNPQQVSSATKFSVNESEVAFMAFNTIKPGPLQNKLVREAIRYAVDPVAIAKADASEATPLSQLIPESIPGYNPAIPAYKQNIAKAKQLLAQAGYPNGLTIRYSTADDSKKSGAIIGELKQVGITATLDYHSDFDEFIDYFSNGSAEMYDVEYSSDTIDGLDIYNTNLAAANYSNPQLNALLDQASTTTDQTKRLKLLQDAAVIINQDIPVVPLSTQEDVYWMDKDYVIHQDMPSSLLSAYFYKVHLK